ncbi:MAG TPA: Crp/Fnr family transcriptional regulator [Saprospiraceae bacterium]|nr:Crp/Fnr family transcriptional regulator [Saprospiraceae bacterium]
MVPLANEPLYERHMEQFFAHVSAFAPISEADRHTLIKHSTVLYMRAGESFLKPGEVCHCAAFLLEGVFRVFVSDDEGREIIRGFPRRNDFLYDIQSFNQQVSVAETWEAMTDARMLVWSRKAIDYLKQSLPSWYVTVGMMLHKAMLDDSLERAEMFSDNATTRYKKFMMRYPEVVAHVPLRHIANYLGIAPQSLSRIRQQISR